MVENGNDAVAGMDCILAKPIDVGGLFAAIEAVLTLAPAADDQTVG